MQKNEPSKSHANPQAKGESNPPFFAPGKYDRSMPPHQPAFFQPKLTINKPGDSYEQEADAMAERVMRMPAPMEEEEPLQAKFLMRKAGNGGYTASPQLAAQLNSSKGGGSPLQGKTLASMNQAFGADFSSVRIHTGNKAEEMSQGIQAKAFTHGADIYFNRGQYSPESSEGKRLLGHELTHVVQQGSRRFFAPPIQCFGAEEHRQIGAAATRGTQGETQTVLLAGDYRITYGEMIALAGDLFGSIDEMRRLAAKPGPGAGTREEIEYARVIEVHGRSGEKSRFSEAARKAVEKRYYTLAADNPSHFVNPNTGDTMFSTTVKANAAGPGFHNNFLSGIAQALVPAASNSLSYYRQYHVRALSEAYLAGQGNASIDSALATEAFSNHYLTDSFSSGHLRTARRSISQYWNAKIPLFFYNFKGMLSERIAKYINDNKWFGYVVSVDLIKDQAADAINKALTEKGMPDFQFGDLVSGAIHDYDNKRGVSATVDGASVRLYGDGNLYKGDTYRVAVKAVKNSMEEVRAVWKMGAAKTPITDVLKQIAPNGLLAAENQIPNVTPDKNLPSNDRSIKWDYKTAFELLSDPYFREGLKIFLHDKKGELASVGDSLKEEYKKTAFKKSVLDHMEGDEGINLIWEVINWTPNSGGGIAGHNQDDNAVDYYEKAKKTPGGLTSLTWVQRANLIRNILDGYTDSSDENAVFNMLTTAPDDQDVRKVIKYVGWGWLEDEIGSRFEKRYPKAKYGTSN